MTPTSPVGRTTYVYSYDNADRLTSEQINGATPVAYAYDAVDQVATVTGGRAETYTYDKAGNRSMAGYATITYNRLSSGAGLTYAYDAEGNLTSKRNSTSGALTTYAWDHRNRLTGVTQKNSGGTVTAQETFTYDALDRLIGRNVDADGAGAGAAVQTWTVYDGDNPYADFSGAGTLQQRYLYGPAVDQILARTDGSGTTAWYLADRQGSVRDLASTSGTSIDRIAYDTYGKVTSESAPASGDRFKYNGREYDATSGLYNNRARWYDPALGRFISTDPIGFAAGDTNLYRYVFNSPTNYTDPSGLHPPDPAQNPDPRKPFNPTKPPTKAPSYWDQMKQAASDVLDAARRAAAEAYEGAKNELGRLPDTARNLGSGMKDTFSDGRAFDSVQGMGQGLFNHFGTSFDTDPLYGNQDAFNQGQGVGSAAGYTMDAAIAAYGGLGRATPPIPALRFSVPAGRLATVGGGSIAGGIHVSVPLHNAVNGAVGAAGALNGLYNYSQAAKGGPSDGKPDAPNANSNNQRPSQLHHYATDKNKNYSPKMKDIAGRYGLDLDGPWNKEVLPHLGRHPNKYHDFVVDGMQRAAREAKDDAAKFLDLYDKYVKNPVRKNPDLLRRTGWK